MYFKCQNIKQNFIAITVEILLLIHKAPANRKLLYSHMGVRTAGKQERAIRLTQKLHATWGLVDHENSKTCVICNQIFVYVAVLRAVFMTCKKDEDAKSFAKPTN